MQKFKGDSCRSELKIKFSKENEVWSVVRKGQR